MARAGQFAGGLAAGVLLSSGAVWRWIIAITLFIAATALQTMGVLTMDPETSQLFFGNVATALLMSVIYTLICVVSASKITDPEPFTVFLYGRNVKQAWSLALKIWLALLTLAWVAMTIFVYSSLTPAALVALALWSIATIGFGATVGLRPRYYAAE